jgi:flagellar basal body-associated protein FliL
MPKDTAVVSAATKTKGPKGLLVIIGMATVVLVASAAIFMVKPAAIFGSPKKPAAVPQAAIYRLGELTTNLSNSSNLKYIQANVVLELNDQTLAKEVKDKEPILQDALIGLFNSKTNVDINTNRGNLKQEALLQLNQHLKTGHITNIYFSELIMQ